LFADRHFPFHSLLKEEHTMKFRTLTVLTLFLMMGVVLAFGACSDSSTSPTGASKGLVFEIDEDGNSRHPGGWKDLHQATDPGEAAFCAGCHTSAPVPEPGCFNATLCHGAGGDDSDELDGDSDDSDEIDGDSDDSDEIDDDSDDSDELEEDSDEDVV